MADTHRSAELRFILQGNKRGLLILATFSLITAISEAFLLAAVVQSVTALSAGHADVTVSLGPWSVHASVTELLASAVVAAVVRGAMAGTIALTGPQVAAASRERHRRRIFEAYLAADWATQSAERTGRLLQVMSSSVNDANTIILMMTQALPALVTLVVLLAAATLLNPWVTVCLMALGMGVGLGMRPFSRRAHRAAQRDGAGRNAIAAHVAGVLTAGAEIKVLGAEHGVVEVGRTRIHQAERAFARAQGLTRLVSVAGQSIAFILVAAGLLVVSSSAVSMNFATLGTITVLLLRGAGLAQQVQGATSQYGAIAPFIQQVREMIEHYERRRQAFGSQPFPPSFDITLENAVYIYPGTTRRAVDVEHEVFAQGTAIALLGPSGSGKSTIIQLILRLRSPVQGRVCIGGTPIESISEEEFSAKVAYLPQAPNLVPGTVLENIRFFRPHVSDAAVLRAARRAHLHDEIESFPAGYDTVLDSHVDRLSGGQKQRLALARALATNPAILVLDEPTSALDPANSTLVMKTFHELRGDTTVIMVTHDQAAIQYCDSVILVSAGKIGRDARSG